MQTDADDTKKRTLLLKVLATLAVIGAINWGLIGFFNFNLVDAIFGGGSSEETSTLSRVIYAIVGLAGLGTLALLPRAVSPGGHTRHTGHTGPLPPRRTV